MIAFPTQNGAFNPAKSLPHPAPKRLEVVNQTGVWYLDGRECVIRTRSTGRQSVLAFMVAYEENQDAHVVPFIDPCSLPMHSAPVIFRLVFELRYRSLTSGRRYAV